MVDREGGCVGAGEVFRGGMGGGLLACVVRMWSAARVKVGEGGVAMGEWGVRVRWNGVQVPGVGRGDMELGGPGRKEGG